MTICLKTNSFALKGLIEIKKGYAFERTSLTFDYGIKTFIQSTKEKKIQIKERKLPAG